MVDLHPSPAVLTLAGAARTLHTFAPLQDRRRRTSSNGFAWPTRPRAHTRCDAAATSLLASIARAVVLNGFWPMVRATTPRASLHRRGGKRWDRPMERAQRHVAPCACGYDTSRFERYAHPLRRSSRVRVARTALRRVRTRDCTTPHHSRTRTLPARAETALGRESKKTGHKKEITMPKSAPPPPPRKGRWGDRAYYARPCPPSRGLGDSTRRGESPTFSPVRSRPALPGKDAARPTACLLYTSPSPRDGLLSRMPSSA